MDDETKARVGKRILTVLLEEGITNPNDVLDMMREGVVGAIEVDVHPTVPKDDKLEEVPQPYLGVLRAVSEHDMYLVVLGDDEHRLPFPERIVRVPKGTPEEKLATAEKALVGPAKRVLRARGDYLRTWVVALARAQGHRLSDQPGLPARTAALGGNWKVTCE